MTKKVEKHKQKANHSRKSEKLSRQHIKEYNSIRIIHIKKFNERVALQRAESVQMQKVEKMTNFNYNLHFREIAELEKMTKGKRDLHNCVFKKSIDYIVKTCELTNIELAEGITTYLITLYKNKESEIFKKLVTYAKNEKITTLNLDSVFGLVSLMCEELQKVNNINKAFIKLLFTESEQEKIKNATIILTRIAETSTSNNKLMEKIKANDLLRNMITDVCGNDWNDANYKQFRNVQITNTKTTTNKANINLMYLLAVKACYLQKYRNLSMKYATVEQIETEKLQRKQAKENTKTIKSIKEKLTTLSKDDLQTILSSLQ